MNATQRLSYLPLAKLWLPRRTWIRDALLVLGGSLLVALLAQVSVPLPFTPVPFTGQTLGVLLVGAALGSRLGSLSMLLYLVEGGVGLRFFAGGGSGLGVLLSVDGGYLIACPLAAALVGYAVERFGADRRALGVLVAFALGSATFYLLGVSGLSLVLAASGHPVSLGTALQLGMWPFLPGDLIKALLAAALLPGSWALVQRRRD